MGLKNVLLDRDGTIIVEKHYLHDPAQVELVPGAGQALGALKAVGLRLYVVTNQSGIGRGYYQEKDFQAVQARLRQLLEPFGAVLDGEAFCPHAPLEQCACRKPEQGLWLSLCAEHGLAPEETVMIGDNASDVAFGLACCLAESILVLTGHGQRFARELGLDIPAEAKAWTRPFPRLPGRPTVLAKDLAVAAAFILKNLGQGA